MTVLTWVCWSIISLTQTAYGSCDFRQGSWRRCLAYQASRARPIARALFFSTVFFDTASTHLRAGNRDVGSVGLAGAPREKTGNPGLTCSSRGFREKKKI